MSSNITDIANNWKKFLDVVTNELVPTLAEFENATPTWTDNPYLDLIRTRTTALYLTLPTIVRLIADLTDESIDIDYLKESNRFQKAHAVANDIKRLSLIVYSVRHVYLKKSSTNRKILDQLHAIQLF